MSSLFRLKIVSKRQVTIPQKMMDLLHLGEGDELQVELEGHTIRSIRPMKVAPVDVFPPEVLED